LLVFTFMLGLVKAPQTPYPRPAPSTASLTASDISKARACRRFCWGRSHVCESARQSVSGIIDHSTYARTVWQPKLKWIHSSIRTIFLLHAFHIANFNLDVLHINLIIVIILFLSLGAVHGLLIPTSKHFNATTSS